MRVVVTHLTRMQYPYVCIAGIDLESGRHVRLIPRGGAQFHLSEVKRLQIRVGSVLDLGTVKRTGSPPEVEDVEVHIDQIKNLGTDPSRMWSLIDQITLASLARAFGPDLEFRGRSGVVRVGKGCASLASLHSPVMRLYLRGRQVRGVISAGGRTLDLSLTDLRYYECEADAYRPSATRTKEALQTINAGTPYTLAMGLTRPYSGNPALTPVHWLQINGIHFRPTTRGR